MKKPLLKSFICLLVLIVLLNIFTVDLYAADPPDGEKLENSNFDLEGYSNGEYSGGESSTEVLDPFADTVGVIISVMRIIGTGVALIIITWIAMKYMMAAPGDRADIKKSSIQYVVGAVILFGSTNILALLIDVFGKLFPN